MLPPVLLVGADRALVSAPIPPGEMARISSGRAGAVQPSPHSPGCQFIEGEPSRDDSCKCGEPTKPLSAYCHEHHKRVWGQGRPVEMPKIVLPPKINARRTIASTRRSAGWLQEVKRLHEAGLSYGDIADRMGVTNKTINGVVNRMRNGGYQGLL